MDITIAQLEYIKKILQNPIINYNEKGKLEIYAPDLKTTGTKISIKC